MKKLSLIIIALVCCIPVFAALPHAFYVKKGTTTTKYNFGVAADLKFSNGGKTLTVTGYNESIDLEDIDYITFSPEVDDLALTPVAQKERLLQIGEDAYSYVHMDRVAELLRMIDVFTNGEYGNNEDGSYYETKCPANYYIPDQYLKKNIKKMLTAFVQAHTGNPAAIHSLRSAALKTYRASDYFGVYIANPETETWDKTADKVNYFEIRFRTKEPGDDPKYYSLHMECSDDFTTWSDEDITIEVPKTINMTFAHEAEELGTAVIETTLEANADMVMTVTSDVSGYHVVNTLTTMPEKMTDIVDITIDGEYYLHNECYIDGQGFTDYAQMYRDIRDASGYWDENLDDYIDGNSAALAAHVKRATVDLDILKKLQVKGKMFNFSLFNERFAKDPWIDDINTPQGKLYTYGKLINWDEESGILDIDCKYTEIIQSDVDYLLDYSDFQFFYDQNPNIQGFISWEMNDDIIEDPFWGGSDSGFCVVDGYLVYVTNEPRSQEDFDNNVKHWGYYCGDGVVPVDSKDVIHPAVMRNHYKEEMPVLIFPDLSSYMFSEFFTSDSFRNLIDDYNEIIETYKGIVGVED